MSTSIFHVSNIFVNTRLLIQRDRYSEQLVVADDSKYDRSVIQLYDNLERRLAVSLLIEQRMVKIMCLADIEPSSW